MYCLYLVFFSKVVRNVDISVFLCAPNMDIKCYLLLLLNVDQAIISLKISVRRIVNSISEQLKLLTQGNESELK